MFDDDYEVDESEAEVAPKPAVVPTTETKTKTKNTEKPAPVTASHTGVPAGTEVSMKAVVYEALARNSMSVRAVQTRLLELGHLGAGADLPGWLSAGTLEALTEFHAGAKLKGEVLSRETIEALFKGLSVKVVG